MESDVGSWIDKFGGCKVCGGEIPYGHLDCCDYYKLTLEIDRLKSELSLVKKEITTPQTIAWMGSQERKDALTP